MKGQGITIVIPIHPEEAVNVFTKFHGNSSSSWRDFQSRPKVVDRHSNIAIHRAVPPATTVALNAEVANILHHWLNFFNNEGKIWRPSVTGGGLGARLWPFGSQSGANAAAPLVQKNFLPVKWVLAGSGNPTFGESGNSSLQCGSRAQVQPSEKN